jgi:hypothetical protein
MQAQEFYDAHQINAEGIKDIIEAAQGGYDDSTPLMALPDSAGQIAHIPDELAMQILTHIEYDHDSAGTVPAIRTTSVNLYDVRKERLNSTEDPDKAHFMVVAASAVIDLDVLSPHHYDIFEPVHRALNIKGEQVDEQRARLRQERIERRAELQAQIDAIDQQLGQDQ